MLCLFRQKVFLQSARKICRMFAEINYIYHYKMIIKEELGKVKQKLEKDGNVICSKTNFAMFTFSRDEKEVS